MIIEFLPNEEKQRDELFSIVESEAKIHFGKDFKIKKNHCGTLGIVVQVKIPNKLYFSDIEKAKEDMFKMEGNIYLKDFVSETLENLSFVPEVASGDITAETNTEETSEELRIPN